MQSIFINQPCGGVYNNTGSVLKQQLVVRNLIFISFNKWLTDVCTCFCFCGIPWGLHTFWFWVFKKWSFNSFETSIRLATDYSRNWGQRPKDTKKALFHYKKVKKGTPNLTSPFIHSLFTIVLIKKFFEKNKSSRAASENRTQF